MEIATLYEMQQQLDERIIKKKGLEGQDLLPNTVLALQVEIGELANEWRGFKHWSSDREPRREVKCHACDGAGGFVGGYWNEGEMCDCCEGTGVQGEKDPLLEEYVDCLHFFLSIARQYGWETEVLYFAEEAVEELRDAGFDGGITGAILEIEYWILRMYMENKPNKKIETALGYPTKMFYFRNAFFIFVVLGSAGFDLTWEQIYQAYLDKNQVNHERQTNGY